MARFRLVPACVYALIALGLPGLQPAVAAEELIDGIAAQVGGEIVLISEVRTLSGPTEARMRAAGAPPEEFARLRTDVLESLVERALIRQVVTRTGIAASEEEVDAAIAAIGEENGLRVEQIRASVESQGLSFADYRGKIRSEIEHTKVVNGMVASKVRIDEAEIRGAYEEQFAEQPMGGTQFHLRQLLVPVRSKKPDDRREACGRAQQLLQQIRGGGADFARLAAKVSPVNPRQGGDIGWLHQSQLAPWMQSAVDSLAAGETSAVIETNFGCNLLQLVERRDYTPVTYEQAREPLRQQLFEERMRAEYLRFVERLRGQTYIERKGFFADAARLGGPPGGSLGSPDGPPGVAAPPEAAAPAPGP